jgi:hypothetical protein
VSADLFISYAWTSNEHREWVRLLASNLKAAGYDVLVDADVDYGDGLNGFMRRAIDCQHVLVVADQNYVERADNLPKSGVGIENSWFCEVHADKPRTWLSVLFKDNVTHALPAWLEPHNPKGHSFNTDLTENDFPGSEQIEELWRWIEGLPANRDHAATVAVLRARGRRLENVDRERDPKQYANPAVTDDDIYFAYERAPGKTYTLGFGQHTFEVEVSNHGAQSVYVYKGHLHAVGLNRSGTSTPNELATQLTPGRHVVAAVGEGIILQNNHGALCLVDLLDATREKTHPVYTPASIRFSYRILLDQ